MQELNKHEIILEVKHSKGPDPLKRKWRFKYEGNPVPPSRWPSGGAEVIYVYFWGRGNSVEPSEPFAPGDLFYLGERSSLENFRKGWKVGRKNGKHKERRYNWLPQAQNRRVFAVAYELPPAPAYTSDENPQQLLKRERRRSLEYLIARDLVERYGETTKILSFAGGFCFRVSWLRAKDLKTIARWILDDLKRSYGV